jgi:hypothetical protein
MSTSYLVQIHETAKLVSTDEFTALRLEEELLVNLLRKTMVCLNTKKKILDRIKQINKEQLRQLGDS